MARIDTVHRTAVLVHAELLFSSDEINVIPLRERTWFAAGSPLQFQGQLRVLLQLLVPCALGVQAP